MKEAIEAVGKTLRRETRPNLRDNPHDLKEVDRPVQNRGVDQSLTDMSVITGLSGEADSARPREGSDRDSKGPQLFSRGLRRSAGDKSPNEGIPREVDNV